MKQVYLAVGPFCWGKADNIETAIKRAKYNWVNVYAGKPSRNKFIVYLFLISNDSEESEIYLTPDGMLTYPTGVEKIQLQMYPEGEKDANKKLGQKM